MCEFFSAISDGKGKTLFFKVEEVVKLLVEGNPKDYKPNSHTSIADFNGIKGVEEDRWNKWEYNVQTKKLKIDQKNTSDDSELVKKEIEKFLEGKNIEVIRNMYGLNSGNRNSGNRNLGDSNSGYGNSGNSNSGYWNSGNSNSGNRNLGDSNSGYGNSGNSNSGYGNSGNRNSGNRNSGNWNSGNWNSGDSNSGYRNSGNRNSGDSNSSNYSTGFFNSITEKIVKVFNKNCNRDKWEKAVKPNFINNIILTQWICFSDMTAEEKANDLLAEMREGYLKRFDYKTAWANAYATATKEDIALLKKLPNFNAKVFKDITGIDVK